MLVHQPPNSWKTLQTGPGFSTKPTFKGVDFTWPRWHHQTSSNKYIDAVVCIMDPNGRFTHYPPLSTCTPHVAPGSPALWALAPVRPLQSGLRRPHHRRSPPPPLGCASNLSWKLAKDTSKFMHPSFEYWIYLQSNLQWFFYMYMYTIPDTVTAYVSAFFIYI